MEKSEEHFPPKSPVIQRVAREAGFLAVGTGLGTVGIKLISEAYDNTVTLGQAVVASAVVNGAFYISGKIYNWSSMRTMNE